MRILSLVLLACGLVKAYPQWPNWNNNNWNNNNNNWNNNNNAVDNNWNNNNNNWNNNNNNNWNPQNQQGNNDWNNNNNWNNGNNNGQPQGQPQGQPPQQGQPQGPPEQGQPQGQPPQQGQPQGPPEQGQPQGQPQGAPVDLSSISFKEAPGNYLEPCQQAGKIVKESYNGVNGGNSLNVYLPFGYEESKQYNIFYLMHGGGENENTIFSNDVKLQHILDHMIMSGELQPLIVVTPTFNKCEARTFYKEFRESVIPFVEGKYSTFAKSTSPDDIKASRMHRAYGGFSMGSASTWAVLVNCLDIVGYFMPLSGDNWEAEGGFGKAKSVADAVNKAGLKSNEYVIFCATGSEDIAYPNMNPQMDEMKKMPEFSGGNFHYLVAPGKTHWWGYVRHYIYDALPTFFH